MTTPTTDSLVYADPKPDGEVMLKYPKQLKKFMAEGLSRATFDRWYSLRANGRPVDENRNSTTLAVTASLFALLMIFLIALAQSRQGVDKYVSGRNLIKSPDERALVWRIAGQGDISRVDLATMQIPDEITLQIRVPAGLAAPLAESASPPVLVLPTLSFKTAEVTINGRFIRQFLEGERIVLPLPVDGSQVPGGMLDIEIRAHKMPRAKPPLMPISRPDLSKSEQSMLVMPFSEYKDLNEFASADRIGRGDYVGFVGRMIMAVFALVLFLLVDASPESLGLALFMGFEALAMSFKFDWLPGIEKGLVSNFCFQMGDLFRIYFALQLARIAPKSTKLWFVFGVPLSLLYGYVRVEEKRLGWTFPAEIPNIRDIIAGGTGVIVCARAASILVGRKLPWRVAALSVAAVGFFEQVVDPLGHYLPFISRNEVFTELVDILQPISAWLLAFSAFINISTLETRVKALSGSEVRAQSIEREMELGRSVQATFLRIPEVPAPVMIDCHHEAAVYVAGDMYFIDWNPNSQQLTVILSDLTGHGVQAALKASATNVIAQTLWSGGSVVQDRRRDRLVRFDGQVQSFLNRLGGDQEMNTMLGLEFDVKSGAIEIFRSNFPMPLLLTRSPEGPGGNQKSIWTVTPVILPNRKLSAMRLQPGSFLLIATDGFFTTSQQIAHLVRFLRQNLNGDAPAETASEIKALFLQFSGFDKTPLPDDRTLIVMGVAAA